MEGGWIDDKSLSGHNLPNYDVFIDMVIIIIIMIVSTLDVVAEGK